MLNIPTSDKLTTKRIIAVLNLNRISKDYSILIFETTVENINILIKIDEFRTK